MRKIPKRYVLIVGAMKSGTTSLFDYLSQHPAICRSKVKEVGFFALDDRWNMGLDWYASFFDYDPLVHTLALEASTDYTKRPYCGDVIERLRHLEGVDYRFVYIMRHPLRRIESHTRHLDRTKREIGRIVVERPDLSLNGGISDVWIDISRYAYQIQPYVEAFGRERIYLTTLEQLTANPAGVVSEIFSFLGLEPVAVTTLKVINEAFDARAPVAAWRAASRIGPLSKIYLALTSPAIRSRLRTLVSVQSSGFGRYTLTEAEEQYIIRRLRDDLRTLSKEYGVDVEGLWGIELD